MAVIKTIKPGEPDQAQLDSGIKVFLAGSIEMGKAEDWQSAVQESMKSSPRVSATLFNPRRDSWVAHNFASTRARYGV